MADSRQGCSQNDEAATGYASSTLGGQQQHQQQSDLVGDVHVRVGRLSDEHGSHGQVDRRTVEVERVTRRDNQTHDRFLGAQTLHLDQHAWQGRFRRGSTQYDQQLFTDVTNQLEDAETVSAADGTQHQHHEQRAGDVEADHQLTQLHQRAYAVGTDGEGHGTERTDGRQLHDHVDDVEHHVGEAIDEVQNRLAVRTQTMQGEAEDHREHQDLQDIAVGKRADDGVRNHVEDEADDALILAGSDVSRDLGCVERADVDVHAGTRLNHVDHDQTDQQSDGRNDLEVQQRITAGLADRLHVLHAGDAADDGTEDDRREPIKR
ncbi:C4-dicarboxylate transport protein [Pseudomonas savastanoi]|uniref:C4-dicarboxylate transport protein n=1 Tax=Pseudomonas savastanoi TaxID=29438 RepID=A0A3M5G3Z8_PSESS|nr:C4-dicarboxylate transport protein [Pseudomonas savastanoi]